MSSAPGSGAGSRRVTIRSISCRGVKSFVPFQKPPLYAAVSLGGRREKTPADADGGENPDWDGAAVAFDLDGENAQELLMRFEVKAQVPLLGNKLVGTASVPVADLAAGGDGAVLRHVSYQVCAPDGKPNGTLSFAYAISSGAGEQQMPQKLQAAVPDGAVAQQGPGFFSAPPTPVTAYPAPSTADFVAPHGGVYPPPPQTSPPASGSLYPPLQDLLPSSSTYPPPPPLTLPHHPATTSPHHFPPGPNNSSYPPPPSQAPDAVYPSPPSAPSSVYPPPPASQDSVYPPPPPPEPGSAYHLLPRSAPSPSPSTMDRELQYHPAPSPTGVSYYPPPELVNGAARTTPYYYSPPAGSRYP